jgi:tyrosine-protein kinase Etk/Wzc
MANPENNLLDIAIHYYSILMRRKWLIAGITGITTIVTIIFVIISIKLPPEKSPLPNTYTAEAILFVQPNEQSNISDSVLIALGMSQQGRPSAGFNNGDMILEILQSRTILDRLIHEFNIFERYGISESKKTTSRALLLASLHFTYARNTGSLRLSFSSTDPVLARDIVNRTVALLDEWFALNRGMAKQKLKLTLEEKLLEVKSDIESLQNRLKNLQRRYGVLNADELGASQASSLANLRSQLILKEIEIKNYSIYSEISDPRLEQLNKELQNLRDLISKNQTTIPDVSQDSGKQRSLADVAQEFSQLTNELDIQQRIFNTLSPQYEAAKLSPESESIFQVFELAEVPDVKTGPKRSKLVIMAFGGSLIFSVGLVLLLDILAGWKKDYMTRKQKTSGQVVP